jgi:hypothetical protein
MTGQELITWIKENNAENLECFVLDECSILNDLNRFLCIEDNSKLNECLKEYGTKNLDESKKSVIIGII